MSDLSGKTIIVTGVGKGIGRACVDLLSHRGARIVTLSRSQTDLEALAAEFGASTIAVDLADNSAARAAIKTGGLADALINCAGTNVLESVLDMMEEGYEQVLGISLRAALICAQEFPRARIANGGGTIVNVTSIAGHRGFVDHVAYAASKAGLEGATRVMAKELGAHGIRVNAVAPTVTMTELAEGMVQALKTRPHDGSSPDGAFCRGRRCRALDRAAHFRGRGHDQWRRPAADGGFLVF